jgi:serine/threonine protein kinase
MNLAKKVAGKLTETELNDYLEKLNIPGPNDPDADNAIIRDNDFTLVSELLEKFGKTEWSLRPRTFCILRMIGCVEAISDFVTEKRTDNFIPYNHATLPNVIKGQDLRSKFFKVQSLVLSPRHLASLELEKKGSLHQHFSHSADEFFRHMKPLGLGKFAEVDHVLSQGLHQYARKRIRRGPSALSDKENLGHFEAELKALKILKHRHLVRLISSYTDQSFVGLIMTPIADEDLDVYLKREMKSDAEKERRNQLLRTFFGCLTRALEYLHSTRTRHKDIKPKNVLIKGTTVLFSDFGTARIHGEDGHSTSVGVVDSFYTPKYASPEVTEHDVSILLHENEPR